MRHLGFRRRKTGFRSLILNESVRARTRASTRVARFRIFQLNGTLRFFCPCVERREAFWQEPLPSRRRYRGIRPVAPVPADSHHRGITHETTRWPATTTCRFSPNLLTRSIVRDRVPGRGVAWTTTAHPGGPDECQLAAGKLISGSSLIVAMVSSVM